MGRRTLRAVSEACDTVQLLHHATPEDRELETELRGLLPRLTAVLPEGCPHAPTPRRPRHVDSMEGGRNSVQSIKDNLGAKVSVPDNCKSRSFVL